MTRDQIKGLAAAAMVCDHFAVAFVPAQTSLYFILRMIVGRIAYPLFLTFFLDGCVRHPPNGRRFLDLFLFGLLSEPFFDKALRGVWCDVLFQNVMLSWFLCAVLALMFHTLWEMRVSEDLTSVGAVCLGALCFCGVCFLASWMRVDYSAPGVVFFAAGWLCLTKGRTKHLWQVCLVVSLMESVWYFTPGALLSVPIMALYRSSDRPCGKRRLFSKYFFYCFYPMHLAFIAILRIAGE